MNTQKVDVEMDLPSMHHDLISSQQGERDLEKAHGYITNSTCYHVFFLQGRGLLQLEFLHPGQLQWVLGKVPHFGSLFFSAARNELLGSYTPRRKASRLQNSFRAT